MTPDEIKRDARAAADRALSNHTQADADAFERLLRRMDDSELRGFAMTDGRSAAMMQRLANAAQGSDPDRAMTAIVAIVCVTLLPVGPGSASSTSGTGRFWLDQSVDELKLSSRPSAGPSRSRTR